MRRLSGILLMVLLVPAARSEGTPILYTMTFNASNVAAGASGPSGTGSFLYDAATDPDTMTALTWDFGSGQTGGYTDAILNSFGISEFLFLDILNETDANPITDGRSLTIGSPGLKAPFPDVSAAFCWGTQSPGCGMANPLVSLASYRFIDSTPSGQVQYRGYVTVAEATAVPEPATLTLLGLGLVGVGARLRRQRRST